jgi:DNA repair exonuclease SbcCD ATPase subunit
MKTSHLVSTQKEFSQKNDIICSLMRSMREIDNMLKIWMNKFHIQYNMKIAQEQKEKSFSDSVVFRVAFLLSSVEEILKKVPILDSVIVEKDHFLTKLENQRYSTLKPQQEVFKKQEMLNQKLLENETILKKFEQANKQFKLKVHNFQDKYKIFKKKENELNYQQLQLIESKTSLQNEKEKHDQNVNVLQQKEAYLNQQLEEIAQQNSEIKFKQESLNLFLFQLELFHAETEDMQKMIKRKEDEIEKKFGKGNTVFHFKDKEYKEKMGHVLSEGESIKSLLALLQNQEMDAFQQNKLLFEKLKQLRAMEDFPEPKIQQENGIPYPMSRKDTSYPISRKDTSYPMSK